MSWTLVLVFHERNQEKGVTGKSLNITKIKGFSTQEACKNAGRSVWEKNMTKLRMGEACSYHVDYYCIEVV